MAVPVRGVSVRRSALLRRRQLFHQLRRHGQRLPLPDGLDGYGLLQHQDAPPCIHRDSESILPE